MRFKKFLTGVIAVSLALLQPTITIASVEDICVTLSNYTKMLDMNDIGSVDNVVNVLDNQINGGAYGLDPSLLSGSSYSDFQNNIDFVIQRICDGDPDSKVFDCFKNKADMDKFHELLKAWYGTLGKNPQIDQTKFNKFFEYARNNNYTPTKGENKDGSAKSKTNNQMQTLGESSQNTEQEINKLLQKYSSSKNINELSKEAGDFVSNNKLGKTEYGNLKSWVTSFYINGDGEVASTWAVLKQRAESSNGTSDPNLKGSIVDDNGQVKAPESQKLEGSAENGILSSDNSKITNKEKAYRFNTTNQSYFKSQLPTVKEAFHNTLEKYASDFPSTELEQDKIKSKHPQIFVVGKDKDGKEVITFDHGTPSAPREYNILAQSLTAELEGLETYTLYQTILDYGKLSDSDKQALTTEYKNFSFDLAKQLYPCKVDKDKVSKSGNPEEDQQEKYFYYNSEALVSNDSTTAKTFNKKQLTVGQAVWERYLKYTAEHPQNDTNTNAILFKWQTIDDKASLDSTGIKDKNSAKTLTDKTIFENNEGIKAIQNYIKDTDKKQTYDGKTSTPVTLSNLAALSLYENLNSFDKDELKDIGQRNNALMITDRFSINKSFLTVDYDNKFLQMELILYSALNPEVIMELYGLDSSKLSTDSQDVEAFKKYMQLNTEYIRELAKTGSALANFYKAMGYPGRAEILQKNIDNMLLRINNDILKPLNLSLIEAYDIGDSIIPIEVKDAQKEQADQSQSQVDPFDDLKGNEAYYELLAWTGCFTPFETNINDVAANMTCLSEEAKQLYSNDNLGRKRDPVYAVIGNTRNITAVKQGNIKQLDTITLRDFIQRVQTDDMVLFTGGLTASQVQTYIKDSVIFSQTQEQSTSSQPTTSPQPHSSSSPTDQSSSSTDSNSSSTSISVTTLPAMSNTTGNSAKYFGPIYVSSCDPNYATKKGNDKYKKAEEEDKSAQELIMNSNIKQGNQQQANSSRQDPALVGNEYSSYGVQSNASGSIYTNAQQAAILSKNLTPSHFYLNYILMWNTLQGGHQNDSGIEADLDRPLYIDCLGDIITESGYVVVPTAANTTYYQTIKDRYPFYTAMMLNAYPEVTIGTDSNISLQEKDNKKFFFAIDKDDTQILDQVDTSGLDTESDLLVGKDKGMSNKKYKYKALRYGGDGTNGKVESNLYITFPGSKFQISTTQESGSIFRVPIVNDKGSYVDNNVIDFIDKISAYQKVGEVYAKVKSVRDSEAKALIIDTYQYINVITDQGVERVALNSISPLGDDPSWKACTSLLKTHFLNISNLDNKDTNSLLCIDDKLIPIAKILRECSDNPQSMLFNDNFTDYNKTLKTDTASNLFGGLFEDIYNKLFRLTDENLLFYTPTLNNINSANASLVVTPATIGILVLAIASVLLVTSFKRFTSNDNRNIALTTVSVILSISFVLYSVYIHPGVMQFTFNQMPIQLLGDDIYDYYLYDLEYDYKLKKDYFFNKYSKEVTRPQPILKLKKLSGNEIMDIRKSQTDRPEINSIFYDPVFDNSRYNTVKTSVFLKGDSLYISVDDLLSGSSVTDLRNESGTYSLSQELYDTADVVSTYTPYYHILETITDTINTYTETCSVGVRVKNYSNNAMLTGRSSAFFSSIFFIAPDHLDDLKKRLENIYTENAEEEKEQLTSNGTDAYNEEVQKIDNHLKEKVDNIDNAFQYILDGMGSTDDWLGLRNILLPYKYPFFSDQAKANMMTADWYPDLENKSESEINSKILSVNQNVKNYVINQLLPVSDKFSDSTFVKMVALRATIEFGREFSTFNRSIYPKQIESNGLDSRSNILLTYVPKTTLYQASSTGLSYLLASTEGWGVIILGGLEALCRFNIYILVIVAIFLLTFLIYGLFLAIIAKRTDISQFFYTAVVADLVICSLRFPLVLLERIDKAFIQNYSILTVFVINLIAYGIGFYFIRKLIRSTRYKMFEGHDPIGRLENAIYSSKDRSNPYYDDNFYNYEENDFYDEWEDSSEYFDDLNHYEDYEYSNLSNLNGEVHAYHADEQDSTNELHNDENLNSRVQSRRF